MPDVPTDDPYFSELRNIILPDAEKQPDRSLAIVFVAIVEDHLTQAIKAHLIDHKKICDGMFNGMGPLATFSAKIDLGILLGLYGADLTKALHALRRIRNTFAHDMRPLTFSSDEIKAKTAALEVIDGLLQRRKKPGGREQFLGACKFILGALHVIAESATRPVIPAKRKL